MNAILLSINAQEGLKILALIQGCVKRNLVQSQSANLSNIFNQFVYSFIIIYKCLI